jgi:hypothetical protein
VSYKYYNFYNKRGEYLNLDYDADSDCWTGRIQHGVISEGLVEDAQIYILEQVYNQTSGLVESAFPVGSPVVCDGGIVLQGAGSSGIDGTYCPDGTSETFPMWTQVGGTTFQDSIYYIYVGGGIYLWVITSGGSYSQSPFYAKYAAYNVDGTLPLPSDFFVTSGGLPEVPSFGSVELMGAGPFLNVYFSPTGASEHFQYGFSANPTADNWLVKERQKNYGLEINSFTIVGVTGNDPGMKIVDEVRSEALQINIGFQPSTEANYSNWLTIEDGLGHVIARIEVYGEGENEDERLKDILQNFGHDILSEDMPVFDKTDINEPEPDWIFLNRKRKELITEFEKIFPYIGSYRALINIIRFFGYQDVHLKEYWRNVDPRSVNYGKFKHTDIIQIFDKTANFRDSLSVPNKIYKKTNLFGLFYDITKETGEYDENGYPVVEEVFSFTPEEVLIKIFALKNKLKKYFLPTNARIIDIVGEAVYYMRLDTTARTSFCRVDAVQLSLHPTYEILPKPCGYIQDLRPLYHYGCPVGPDLLLDGTTDLFSWRIGIGNTAYVGGILDGIQTYALSVNIPFGPTSSIVSATFQRDPDTGQTAYSGAEIANGLIAAWNDAAETDERLAPFTLYQEGGSSGIIRILQTEPGSTGQIFAYWYSNTTGVIPSGKFSIPGPTGGTATTIDISPGGTFGPSGAPMSYYNDCFLAYFDNINLEVAELNDDEDIPVGYPITLVNTTFDISWDEAEVTFNDIDQTDFGQTGPTGQTYYSQFNQSFQVTGWTSIYPNPGLPSGATYLSIAATAGMTGFPSNFPTQNVYSWINLGRYNFYEMQWKVTFDGDIDWSYDSGRKTVSELERHSLILPYAGTYTVELRMWDLYNTVAIKIDPAAICVKMQECDFIGWYQMLEKEYTFDTPRYEVQSDYSKNDPRYRKPKQLTWDEYVSTWELPFHPNEEIGMAEISYNSLDGIEFYQNITDEDRHPLADRNPYYFHKIGKVARFKDLYHLWWDGIGTKITQFSISECSTGPTGYMFMTLENCPFDITDPNMTISYVQGPTGYTGPLGITGATGATGDVIYSAYDSSVYRYDGSVWKRTYATMEGFPLRSNYTNRRSRFQNLVSQLNFDLYDDARDLPMLRSFIYYFDEKYDTDYSLKPYVRAVSKDFDKHNRHRIRFQGMTGDSKSYETTYFGYMGDIPSHFEIYTVSSSTGPSSSITVEGMTAPYLIGATNLIYLADELNGPTAQSWPGIREFSYNLVLGWSGGTGSTSYYETKVQAISKAFTSPDKFWVEFDNVIGTIYGRSLIKNPTFDNLRILKYSKRLPVLSLLNFTYDNCQVHGKKKPVWKLSKELEGSTVDTYDRNRYFSFLFTEKGSYTLSLKLEDTNGNVVETTKRELIIVE